MTRQEIIENSAIELAGQKLEIAIKHNTEYYKANRCKIEESFLQAVDHGLLQCIQTKKKIGYITISVLESSLITKTYDLQIAFYSKDLYADSRPIYEYWAPMFIYENLDSDIKEIKELLKSKVIHLKPYEIYELKHQYASNFYFLIGFMMRGLGLQIGNLHIYQQVDKEKQIKILFGKYMEKQTEIVTLGA